MSGFSGQLVPDIAKKHRRWPPILEHEVRKVGLAQELPNILRWVQPWRLGLQEQDREVFRDLQCAGFVLTRAVHDEDAVGFGGDGQADLLKMFLHDLGLGVRHHQGRALGCLLFRFINLSSKI